MNFFKIIIFVFLFFAVCGLCSAKRIEIREAEEGKYLFYLEGEPFLVKGVAYNPIPVGKGYDYNFLSNENKPWLIDGQLMKDTGINCVRVYSVGKDLEKARKFIQDMYEKFGIYTIVSDWLGLWDYPPANYANGEFKQKVEQRILKLTKTLKDEDGLLMWILGNENNYTFSGKIGFWTSPAIEKIEEPQQKQIEKARIYYSFVDELAKKIKDIDKVHPVALGNGEASYLDVAAKVCQSIDILAINIYRGKEFGNLFNNIRNSFDRPVLLSEFGCDSYDAYRSQEDQDIQAEFLLSQWKNLYKNTGISGNEKGNSIGGCLFEWTDEWWKHNESHRPDWSIHNREAGWSDGSYFFDIKAENNLNMNEEWFGIVSLGENIENGVRKRIPKKALYILKDFFSRMNN